MPSAHLASVTEEIVNLLNTSPDDTWSDLKVGIDVTDYVQARPCLDPLQMFEKAVKNVYVCPVVMLWNREGSKGRQGLVQLSRSPVISICLSIPIRTLDAEGVDIGDPDGIDVGSWETIKKILNLREEIDNYILGHEFEYGIRAITAEPAQEIMMKQRWFLSVTEIEFEMMSCSR